MKLFLDFNESEMEETSKHAKEYFNKFAKSNKEFINENEFYELIENYLADNNLKSEIFLFKQDDFFHTFVEKSQEELSFDEFVRLFEDVYLFVKMKKEDLSKQNVFDFDIDLKLDDDIFEGLI